MKRVSNVWPTSHIATNAKFAAQVFREALDNDSFESFRVALLDASSLLAEIADQARLVTEGATSPSSVAPCLEELKYLIDHDPVVKGIIDLDYRVFISNFHGKIKEDARLKEMASFAQMLHDKTDSSYRTEIESTLTDLIRNGVPGDQIRKTVNYYCAHLINSGFSKQYIAENVEDWFFNRDIKKIEQRTTSRFLSRFDKGDLDYVVLINVSNAFHNYVSQLGIKVITSVEFDNLPSDASTQFATVGYQSGDKFVRLQIQARDPIKSVGRARNYIDLLNSVGYLERRAILPSAGRKAYVIRRKGQKGQLTDTETVFRVRRSRSVSSREITRIRRRLQTAMVELNRDSWLRFFSALSMASLSAETDKEESQFIALWSSLEVLLGNPERGGNRGDHYVETIVPCLAIGYVDRYVDAILKSLRLQYSRQLRSFFSNPDFRDLKTTKEKFVSLNFDRAHAALVPTFDAIFSDNPLAADRLRKMRDNFSSPAAALRAIDQFEERVRWQTARIYRVRNSIVHAGSPPNYLAALTRNVFETFVITADAILRHCSSSRICGEITQASNEIRFKHTIKMSWLKSLNSAGASHFSSDDLQKLLA